MHYTIIVGVAWGGWIKSISGGQLFVRSYQGRIEIKVKAMNMHVVVCLVFIIPFITQYLHFLGFFGIVDNMQMDFSLDYTLLVQRKRIVST